VAALVANIANNLVLQEHLWQRVKGIGHWTGYFRALDLALGAMDASRYGSITLDDLDASMSSVRMPVSSREFSPRWMTARASVSWTKHASTSCPGLP
jgi:hypothetical protein